MPKLKTHKGAKKRMSVTATGKIKRTQSGKSHIMTKKTSKRKRQLGKGTIVDKAMHRKIAKILPYG